MRPCHEKPPPALARACLNSSVPPLEPVHMFMIVSAAPLLVATMPVRLKRVDAADENGVTSAVEVMLLFEKVDPAACVIGCSVT